MMKLMRKTIECTCDSMRHLMVIESDEEEGLVFHLQIVKYKSLLSRLWAASKYVIGIESGVMDWDCTWVTDLADLTALRDMCSSEIDRIRSRIH